MVKSREITMFHYLGMGQNLLIIAICGGITIHSPTILGYLGCQGFDS